MWTRIRFLYRPCRRLIDAWPRCAEPLTDDHEHASGLVVRLDAHELLDQLVERDDPVLLVATIEQLRAAHVPRREVAQSPAPLVLVLVLDALPALGTGLGGQRRMLARPGLDRGLLIAADHVVAGM